MVEVVREVEYSMFCTKNRVGLDGQEHLFRGIRSDTCGTHTKQIEGSIWSQNYFSSCFRESYEPSTVTGNLCCSSRFFICSSLDGIYV